MKVLLLLDWQLYYIIGLANALSQEHSVLLITRDHNYEISSPDEPMSLCDFLKETLDERVAVDKLHYRRRDLRSLGELIRLSKVIERFDPDVIHIQETTDWRIVFLSVINQRRRVVVTVHDVNRHAGESRGWQVFLWHSVLRISKSIIVHGEFLKKQFIEAYPKYTNKVQVVPHGVYKIYRTWDDPTVQEERGTALFFGRISQYKGIDVLIKAWHSVIAKVPGSKLIIAGQGQDFTPYARMIGDMEGFEVHNRFIPHTEVPKFFRRASVVVLPYIEASQSGVVALAYAFGKPVVVTKVGSIPEVVEDGKTGFVVPPNNPKALADGIIRIFKEQKLKCTMCGNVLKRAQGDLSWEAIAKKTETLYRNVIESFAKYQES